MITHKLATLNRDNELVDVYECELCRARWTEKNMLWCYSCHAMKSSSLHAPDSSQGCNSLSMQNLKTGEGVSSPFSSSPDTNAKEVKR